MLKIRFILILLSISITIKVFGSLEIKQADSISLTINNYELIRNSKGFLSGAATVKVRRTVDGKEFVKRFDINPDTVKVLLNHILELGLLKLEGNNKLQAIDGRFANFKIARPNDYREFSLQPSSNYENGRIADEILSYLNRKLKDDERDWAFFDTLPVGEYLYGGLTTDK